MSMKKTIILLSFVCLAVLAANSQTSGGCGSVKPTQVTKPTSIGIVIYSNDAETAWNAFRFANYAMEQKDTVSIFLLGKGVEVPKIDNMNFTVKEELEIYSKNGGKILACGTCLTIRNEKEPKMCSVSSLSDLYNLIKINKKILSF
jgi:sulfur relay (sulfurtransferase) complex TusBCD TusD component (DsrE family)